MWSEKPCEVGAKERMVIKRGKMLGKKSQSILCQDNRKESLQNVSKID